MNQNIKLLAMFLVFASLTTMALGIIPKASAAGPATSNLLIHIYLDPVQEENALGKGDIDINDWPLSKTFITTYANNPAITLNEYAEIGEMEFDINDQLWPTGAITSPRTGAKNTFTDPTGVRDIAALHFRRAIAHLANKAKYTTTYMGGYGYVMETVLPVPALEGFTDYSTLTNATAKGETSLKAAASSGATRIYVYSTKCFSASQWIVIGGTESKHIAAVGTDYFDLSTELQLSHSINEDVYRVILRGTSTKLKAAASSGASQISVLSTVGFAPGQWIRIGIAKPGVFEQKKIDAVGADYFTLTTTLQNSHSLGEIVALENRDPGYLYEYNRDLAAGELLEGGFADWDDDGFREWSSDGVIYEELPNMKLWARLDDPNRRQAGQDLYNELLLAGIPQASGAGAAGLEIRIAERSSCFAAAMVNYDYNIYTGGWSLTADPDFIYDFFHSSMGQYSYANNYPGFKNHEFDAYAEAVKFAPPGSDVKFLAVQAQWILAKYVGDVWLWAAKAVKGYRTGWQNVVNYAGFGTDNGYSFDLMSKTGDNTIDYGFKSDISALQVITSEWLWDWNVLGLIYDTLIARNPYNLAEEVGTLASAWSVTSNYPGWVGKAVCEFTVRSDAKFNDGTPVKPADVAYSLLVPRSAGQGNAWVYSTVMDINKVEIQGQVVRVFFNSNSIFSLHWSGFISIINKDLWNSAIGLGTPSNYAGFIPDDTDGTYLPVAFPGAPNMRNYHPWEADANSNGITDIKEDGSYSWKYVNYVVGQSVALTGNTNFPTTMYRKTGSFTEMERIDFVTAAFHGVGNVNYEGGHGATQVPPWYTTDRKIDLIGDLARIATSLTSNIGGDWGPGPLEYNPDADILADGNVNVIDLGIAGANFGKTMG